MTIRKGWRTDRRSLQEERFSNIKCSLGGKTGVSFDTRWRKKKIKPENVFFITGMSMDHGTLDKEKSYLCGEECVSSNILQIQTKIQK